MKNRRIICFGDSNTYGWDPRYFSTNRYDHAWPDILADMTGYDIKNLGQPGRTIYYRDYQYRWFDDYVNMDNHDLLILMLGSNDLLNTTAPHAEIPLERTRIFLDHILEKGLSKNILLLSPPMMKLPNTGYGKALTELADQLKVLAEEKGIQYADTTKWNIPLAFDGVHFTEEGHRLFAENILKYVM